MKATPQAVMTYYYYNYVIASYSDHYVSSREYERWWYRVEEQKRSKSALIHEGTIDCNWEGAGRHGSDYMYFYLYTDPDTLNYIYSTHDSGTFVFSFNPKSGSYDIDGNLNPPIMTLEHYEPMFDYVGEN